MNAAAQGHGCSAWAEKTPAHTLYLGDILKSYPDAKVIAITRRPLDVVVSNVYKFSSTKNIVDYLKACFWTVVYEKYIRLHEKNIMVLQYEDLLSSFNKTAKDVLDYLGLTALPVSSRFAPDSAFGAQRAQLNLPRRIVCQLAIGVFSLLPAPLCAVIVGIRNRSRKPTLPSWFFRVFDGEPYE